MAKRKWIVWGCAGCLLLLVLGAAAVGAFYWGITAVIRRSEAYETALARATAHPVVEERIGTPLEPGWLLTGSVNVTGPGGEAQLSIPVSGPRGEGTLYVEATRQAGVWELTLLDLVVEATGERIDLLVGAEEAQQPPPEPPPTATGPEALAGTTAGGPPSLGPLTFARDIVDGEMVGPGESFAAGTPEIYGVVFFSGLEADDELADFWYHEEEKINDHRFTVGEAYPGGVPAEGGLFVSLDRSETGGFPAGEYRVELWVNGQRLQSGRFVVTPGS